MINNGADCLFMHWQQQSESLELCPAGDAVLNNKLNGQKGEAACTETLHAGQRVVDGDLQRCSTSSVSSSPQKRLAQNHESQSPASRQPSVMQKPLASPHRCKVNHAVASQSVILCPLLHSSDKPVTMACVEETCRSKRKEAWIGMRLYESGIMI